MLYRNTKTGAVIDVNSAISGGNWQAVESAKQPEKKTSTKKEKVTKDE